MKTEEIEKAAISANPSKISESVGDFLSFNIGFKAGAEFVNKYWQEKTKWIPVEEKIPPRGSETRQIFVKNENKHSLNWMIVSCFDEDYFDDIEFIKREFTHWKEIE